MNYLTAACRCEIIRVIFRRDRSSLLTRSAGADTVSLPVQGVTRLIAAMNQTRLEQIIRATPQRGSNQVAVRSYNERLVLQIIRNHHSITKAEVTKATGLSPNAVSVIFRSLEEDNLVLRGKPIKGRIGQPSVPMRLNPDAKLYAGLKIGRRSSDLVLIDFLGEIRAVRTVYYELPLPEAIMEFAEKSMPELLGDVGKKLHEIDGFGVAMPWELWDWSDDFGAPRSELSGWRTFDPRFAFSFSENVPTFIENDGSAACGAELAFGPHEQKQDFIYFFVGTLIGGGVVLNGSLFRGRTGNAGGFGPLRVPGGKPGKDRLIDHASLSVLEKLVADAGGDPLSLHHDESAWKSYAKEVDIWLERTAMGLAHAIVSSAAVIDFEAVVIDGAIPPDVRTDLTDRVSDALDRLDLLGIHRPSIEAGRFGALARAIGGATLPLANDYMINQNTLLRS